MSGLLVKLRGEQLKVRPEQVIAALSRLKGVILERT